MDYSPEGSPVHGISQARILEWVAISFSKGSFWPRDGIWISALQADSLLSEPPGKQNFSHKKEHIWLSSNKVDEPRAHYIEWSQVKSERERQSYINAYIWNLERVPMNLLTFAGSNGDIENRLLDTIGEGEEGTNWANNIERYTWSYVKLDSQ